MKKLPKDQMKKFLEVSENPSNIYPPILEGKGNKGQMKKLPNGPELTDLQLNKYCYANIPGFKGCHDRVTFAEDIYKTMSPGDSVIINLDPKYQISNGTHWVGFRVSSVAPLCFYRDSFGYPPAQSIVDAVRNGNPKRGLLYGDVAYQKKNQTNCGHHAAMFLENMAKAAKDNNEIDYYEAIA